MDDIDRKIIRLLQEDARKSFNKIAESLGIAVGTAYNRVKNLEDKGILLGYTILLDPTKLGYGLTALILIQADGRYLPEVEKAHVVRLRRSGPIHQGEIEIKVSCDMTVREFNAVKRKIIKNVKSQFPDVEKLTVTAIEEDKD